MKLLTIAVPCYNSAAYMEKCIQSLLPGGEEVEILIVDDGSKDDTALIADRLEAQHPGIVRAIHQPNKGHGGAVNTGIENASGLYFKVVDSDDKVGAGAYKSVLHTLRQFSGGEGQEPLDLLISNFVYNKEGEHRHKVMQYRRELPRDKVISWSEAGRFRKGHYILMHSAIYRTELLRDCGLKLPEHTFYVDNIYVFHPLPYVNRMYYLDVNFYYYFIGRSDQSVNEEIMIGRLDQQARVNRIMIDYFTDPSVRRLIGRDKALYRYMYNYLEIIMTITSVLAICSGKAEHLALKKEVWDYLKERDGKLFARMRHGMLGTVMHLPGEGGRKITMGLYKAARRIFNFN